MKATFLSPLLLILLLFGRESAWSQTISVSALSNNSKIVDAKKIIFDGSDITLDNVSLKCEEIEFSSNVKKIKVTGRVILECIRVKFKLTTAIALEAKEGTLTIEFSEPFDEGTGIFSIKKGNATTLVFKKKPEIK